MLSRRWFLGAGAAGLAVWALGACSDDDTADGADGAGSTATSATSPGATATTVDIADFSPADFAALGTCVLLPEQTAGPLPLDEQFDRRDVTEGYPGTPMRLGFRVVDDGCVALPGAVVEIWHTDASGDYSAYADGGTGKDEAEGTTFFRGSQTASEDGIAEFHTIVPGWYSGRAVHIHLRVHVDDRTVLTSQVYFDEGLLADVYAADPYAEFGMPDTSNEADGIAGDPESDGTLLATSAGPTRAGDGVVALLNLGVNP
jgi:protocatechuate 3,4-dioxygenase beta subunit